MRYLMLILLLAGCTITVRQEEPAVVEHRINLDEVEEYFVKACAAELNTENPDIIDECVADYMANFIELFGDSL
jgi:hypothetical protein